MNDYYLIAKIASVFNNKGYVKLESFSDIPDRFFSLNKVFLDFFGDKKEFFVQDVKKIKNFFVLKFKNFDEENDLKILIDKEIFVDKNDLVELPENTFFIHDLIGSKVIRNSDVLGKIKDVLNFPANDVYVIEDADGEEILIPAVKDFIENFDSQNKILTLKPGNNLYEDDED